MSKIYDPETIRAKFLELFSINRDKWEYVAKATIRLELEKFFPNITLQSVTKSLEPLGLSEARRDNGRVRVLLCVSQK